MLDETCESETVIFVSKSKTIFTLDEIPIPHRSQGNFAFNFAVTRISIRVVTQKNN